MGADKEEIRARNDIVELIGSYVALKRRGRSFVGLCPFHLEKTPSFHVSQETQTFTCFGCGAKGDVFTFVEKHENLSFVEAAEFLARRVGLTFERRGGTGQESNLRERLYEVNGLALAYFRRMYQREEAPRAYLEQRRGIAAQMVDQFKLGFALDNWSGLTGYLRANRHDLAAAEAAGLIARGRTGDYYDVFRNRIIFPIFDEQERVVGFGGRAFGDEEPKYLNTTETPIFNKSRQLYGLHLARKAIAQAGRALLMEGYMDVIAAHQAGFTHAVATLGTALTETHARRLARLFPENPTVVLVYDADRAGIKATLRASELLEGAGITVRVVQLPADEDPDSLLRRPEGRARFQRAIDGASGRVEYLLDRIAAEADHATEEGRARMLRQMIYVLATVPLRSERDFYVERVARHHPFSAASPDKAKEMIHADAEAVAARLRAEARRAATPSSSPPASASGAAAAGSGAARQTGADAQAAAAKSPPPTAEERAERLVIRGLLTPRISPEALKALHPEDFVTELGRQVHAFALERAEEIGKASSTRAVLELAADTGFCEAVRTLLQEMEAEAANIRASTAVRTALTEIQPEQVLACARTLRKHRMRMLKQELARMLARKQELTEEDRERIAEHQRLLTELGR